VIGFPVIVRHVFSNGVARRTVLEALAAIAAAGSTADLAARPVLGFEPGWGRLLVGGGFSSAMGLVPLRHRGRAVLASMLRGAREHHDDTAESATPGQRELWHSGEMTSQSNANAVIEQRGTNPSAAHRAARRSWDFLHSRSPYLRKAPRQYGSELVRTHLATGDERRLLAQTRGDNDVCWAETDEAEPLVTVRIATYNRGSIVAERAIASAIRQTYERLEILVIGDHCDESTVRAVTSVNDPRLRFINLAEHGLYPKDPVLRWMVAGCAPMNAGLAVAQGSWIAPCDDDDEITDDHVEVLLREARARRLEFVWSKAATEVGAGKWSVIGSTPLAHGQVTHGSVLFAGELRFFRYNENSWKLAEPFDWNLWRRMHAAGVKMGFVDEVTYKYFEAYHRPGRAIRS